MPTTPRVSIAPVDAEVPALKSALDERRPFLLAMPEDQVDRQPRVDASVAAEIVIGTIPQLVSHRAGLVALCGPHAGTLVDEMPVVARATKMADADLTAAATPSDLSPMEADLRGEHMLLVTDAQSLANRKLIDPLRIDPARGVLGYRQLIHNTIVLVSVLREHWSTISELTPLTAADLDRAENKANRMLTTLGERDQVRNRVPAAELRFRALTDLVRRYEELRRMVTYLRWYEKDFDVIVPSLYARRGSYRPREDEDTETTTPVNPPVATPAGGSPGAPSSPSTS